MIVGLHRKHALERKHGALGVARVERRDAEQVIEFRIAGPGALLRQQKLVGLFGLPLVEQALGAIGQLIAECRRTGRRERAHGQHPCNERAGAPHPRFPPRIKGEGRIAPAI